jgi:hypothetical protein
MFADGFTERRDLEQYFWTEETVDRLKIALTNASDCCCMATPSLAYSWHCEEREEVLLDIDTRFDFLPKFRYWDIRQPTEIADPVRYIVFDPPFFYIDMDTLYRAVLTACGGNTKTKLLIGFLKREEPLLLKVFSAFGLKRTNFQLNYAHVSPNKWRNYALYSNVDLPGIRREKDTV